MRSDISRVIIGRERTHSSDKDEGRKDRHREERLREDAPYKESMSRHRFNRDKELTDVLAPLVGYLQKHVGKNWDKIHKDISSHLKVTSMAQSHVLDHLNTISSTHLSYNGFYVDPRTKILRLSPIIKFKANRNTAPKVTNVGGKTYKKLNDSWFEIELTELPPKVTTWRGYSLRDYFNQFKVYPPIPRAYVLDVLFGVNAYDIALKDKYGRLVYCSARKLVKLDKVYKLGLEARPSAKPNLVRKRRK